MQYLQELLKDVEIIPAVNQIENHPYLPQDDVLDLCKERGIVVEAYSPLGSTGSPMFKEEGVQEIAKKYDVGPGTVLISYQGSWLGFVLCCVQFGSTLEVQPQANCDVIVARGIVPLPKSVTKSRIEENLKVIDLDSSDMEALNKLHKTKGITRFVNPPFGVRVFLKSKEFSF